MLIFTQRQTHRWPQLLRHMAGRLMEREVRAQTQPYLVNAVQGAVKPQLVRMCPKKQRFGEDSWFVSSTPRADVLGVADGVGSWRELGIDAGRFAKELMHLCANYASQPHFDGRDPRQLLIDSYTHLCEQARPVLGSSTACLAALHRGECKLYTANLGDSGYLVLRNGKVLQRSEEQLHTFNTPYQLTLPPEEQWDSVHCDRPELASCGCVPLQEGDLVLLATDGLFDNVPESMLLKLLRGCQGATRKDQLQLAANVLVNTAQDLSQSEHFQSPFAMKARANNMMHADGGKPDDITVILASVAVRNK